MWRSDSSNELYKLSDCLKLRSEIRLNLKMKAIVIGSGISGLSAAIRLSVKGYEVQIFEKNSYTGGKVNALRIKGYRFDTGPSLFTMPAWVDELYELANEDPRRSFNYLRKETICKYFWEDGSRFTADANQDKFIHDASMQFDVSELTLLEYLQKSKLKYESTRPVFLEKSLHKISTYLSKDTLRSLLSLPSLNLGQTLDTYNQKKLKEPHLVQLFNRYATYNGSSPYKTPGIMSLIPHLEMDHGTYLPKGGMHEISQGLTRLAERVGVKISLNSPVDRIVHNDKNVSGIRVNSETLEADVVVSNMDVFSTYKHLLPNARSPKRILKQERSSSALIFYWGINRNFDQLDLHNILFAENYQEEFQHLFEMKLPYSDPTVYINITSKDLPEDAPDGKENWFVMINVPGDTSLDWGKCKAELRKAVILKINRLLNTSIEDHIEVEETWDPSGIEKDTFSYQGSLYGTSSNSKFAAFLRHPNFSGQFNNLFFCGGSAHPGGGIPLCLLSAKIVSDLAPTP